MALVPSSGRAVSAFGRSVFVPYQVARAAASEYNREYSSAIREAERKARQDIVRDYENSKRKMPRKSRRSKKTTKRSKKVTDGIKVGARGGAPRVTSKKLVKTKGHRTVSKRVDAIEKQLGNVFSYKYIKLDYSLRCSVQLGNAAYQDLSVFDSNIIRSHINALPIATGTDIDATAIAERATIGIEDIWSEIQVVNTFDAPLCVDIYAFTAKVNTNDSCRTELFAQMVNMGYAAAVGQQTQPAVFPSHCPDLFKHYKSLGHTSAHMRGGDILKLKATLPNFKWSDDYYDTHSNQFLRKMNIQFLVRVQGHVCYDSANSVRISYIPGEVSAIAKTNFSIKYTGNVVSKEIEYATNLNTAGFTGTPTTIGPNVVNLS